MVSEIVRKGRERRAAISRIVRKNATPMWKIKARAFQRRKLREEMNRNKKGT